MALKQLCKALQQCAEALEQEIKTNINEFHNLIFGKNLDEVKLALERAKDYHYKEIADAASEVLKNIKKIIFHEGKIEWLSNEANFKESDLKRFSYVKRQVYAFSKTEEPPAFSRSVENLTTVPKNKRERRRTASEISIGTLEAWEKYMDKKEKDKNQLAENVVEVKKTVHKRTLSKARARKKFVSSTTVGFLDGDGRASSSLDSIIESSSVNEDDEDNEFNNNVSKINEAISENSDSDESCLKLDVDANTNAREVNNCLKSKGEDEIYATKKGNSDISEIPKANAATNNTEEYIDLVERVNNKLVENDEILNKIMEQFLNDEESSERNTSCQRANVMKPKIVDVIYKKKPS